MCEVKITQTSTLQLVQFPICLWTPKIPKTHEISFSCGFCTRTQHTYASNSVERSTHRGVLLAQSYPRRQMPNQSPGGKDCIEFRGTVLNQGIDGCKKPKGRDRQSSHLIANRSSVVKIVAISKQSTFGLTQTHCNFPLESFTDAPSFSSLNLHC
jgi:hypothetical protein